MEGKIIATASDIVAYEQIWEDGGNSIEPLLFECPICGGIFDYSKMQVNHISGEENLIAVRTYRLSCENHDCLSSFIYTNLSSEEIDYEERAIIGYSHMADYMYFIETPNINRYVPHFLQRYFKLAYETLPISPESAAVYVRKMLESFINNTWIDIKNAKTSGKRPRSLNLYEKINLAYKNIHINQEEKDILDKIRNVFNSAAHDGTNSHNMTCMEVTKGLNILMKVVRKHAPVSKVSAEEKATLDNLKTQYGI